MEALIRFLQNNALFIFVMTIITLLGGLMGIILGWKRFYDDFLSKSITLPVYVLIILFVFVALAIRFLPATENRPVYVLIILFLIALALIFRPATKDRPKELQIIKGESFGVQRIFVDGKRFVNCTFGKTELVYRGEADVGIENCSFKDPGFTLTFDGPANFTINTLTNLYADPGFRPRIENTLKNIREGKHPIATPPSDAADG